MSTGDWVKLLLAAGAVALVVKAAGGPNKRPSVDGLPVYQNGNSPAPEPGDFRYHSGPAYC
jgi:hypothetical protein